jgi:hypothetical protein
LVVTLSAFRFLQGISQDSQANRIEAAARQLPFLVSRFCQLPDQATVPGQPGGINEYPAVLPAERLASALAAASWSAVACPSE